MIGHSSRHCSVVTSLPLYSFAVLRSSSQPAADWLFLTPSVEGWRKPCATTQHTSMRRLHAPLELPGCLVASSVVSTPISALRQGHVSSSGPPGWSKSSSACFASTQATGAGVQTSRQAPAAGQILELNCTALAFGGQVIQAAGMLRQSMLGCLSAWLHMKPDACGTASKYLE